MKSYGMAMQGQITIEKVEERPDWSSHDIGRFIYETSTGMYWLGGHSNEIAYAGWVPIGLSDDIIKAQFIDWDDELIGHADKVSAETIPCWYGDSTSNVQLSLNMIIADIKALATGALLEPGSIKDYHLDTTGPHKITADTIPIVNDAGYFSANVSSIEDALNYLYSRKADSIAVTSGFGSILNFSSGNVQQALEDLEAYISELSAEQIKATYPATGEVSNVQYILDAYYNLLVSLNFTQLTGTPSDYGIEGQYLRSDGDSSTCWATIDASEVTCLWPGCDGEDSVTTNVQDAICQLYELYGNCRPIVEVLLFCLDDAEVASCKADYDSSSTSLPYIFDVRDNTTWKYDGGWAVDSSFSIYDNVHGSLIYNDLTTNMFTVTCDERVVTVFNADNF